MWSRSINEENHPCTWQVFTEHSSNQGLGLVGNSMALYLMEQNGALLWYTIAETTEIQSLLSIDGESRHSTTTDLGFCDSPRLASGV